MTGIGTLVNVCAIILGGFLGLLFKGGLKQHYQDAVLRCLGLCTLFIGAAGGLSGLLSVSGTRLESGGSLGMILSLVLGTLVGERLNLEGRLGQLGEWLKARASRGEDSRFVEGFVTASLVVCVGAMAISGRTGPRSLHPFHKGHPGLHDYHGILLHLRQGGHLFCPSRRGPSGERHPLCRPSRTPAQRHRYRQSLLYRLPAHLLRGRQPGFRGSVPRGQYAPRADFRRHLGFPHGMI